MAAVVQPRSIIENSSHRQPLNATGDRKAGRSATFPKGPTSGVRTSGGEQRSMSAHGGSLQARSPANSRRANRLTWAKLLILAALLCLWVVIALVRWPSATPLRRSAVSTDVKGPRIPGGTLASLPQLKTELLRIPHELYPPQVTSMFAAPPPPPSPPVEAVRPVIPPPSAPPPDPFAEAAKQLHFLGFLKSDATAAAFITRGTELFVAAVGDTVAERFRVVSVQENAVTLASPEGDKQVRLALAAAGGASTASILMVSSVAASPRAEEGVTQEESTGEVLAQNREAPAVPDPLTAAVLRERAERAERIGSRTRMLPQ